MAAKPWNVILSYFPLSYSLFITRNLKRQELGNVKEICLYQEAFPSEGACTINGDAFR